MSGVTAKAIGWTESGLVPDTVIRGGMRRLLERKLAEIRAGDVEFASRTLNQFADMMRNSPVAPVPELANEQHYEVPAEFFSQVLGEHRKYSCCHWAADVSTFMPSRMPARSTVVLSASSSASPSVLTSAAQWQQLYFRCSPSTSEKNSAGTS